MMTWQLLDWVIFYNGGRLHVWNVFYSYYWGPIWAWRINLNLYLHIFSSSTLTLNLYRYVKILEYGNFSNLIIFLIISTCLINFIQPFLELTLIVISTSTLWSISKTICWCNPSLSQLCLILFRCARVRSILYHILL